MLLIADVLAFIKVAGIADLESISKEVTKAKKKFPKEVKTKRVAVVKEKTPAEILLTESLKACREEWLRRNARWQWDYGKDDRGLKELLKKIGNGFYTDQQRLPTVEELTYSFFELVSKLPPYFSKAIDFNYINSKFNQIISEIEKSPKGGKTTNNLRNGIQALMELQQEGSIVSYQDRVNQ
jgi:hypothetical protein